MKRLGLFLALLLYLSPLLRRGAGGEVFAQIYPVQLSTQLIPPYSGYLVDYADPSSEKLRLILQFNDFTVPQYNVRLKLEIKGNGFTIVSKQYFNPPPIVIQPGVPVLISGTDLAPYLNSSNLDFIGINQSQYEQGKSLPEGYYSICVTAFDYYLSNTQVSNEACAQAWFTLSDPPFLNLPLCNTNVIPQTPQNILFQWTPMNMGSPNSAFNTEYDFELWEMRPDSTVSADQVAQSTPPIYKITTQQTLLNYGLAEPELTLYMKYAWRVRARDISGKDLFKNKGYSQVCTFNYGSIGKVLGDAYELKLTAQGVTHRLGKCSWNLEKVFKSYLLQVRKQGTGSWFIYNTTINSEKITNLEPNTTYEARVRGEGSDIITGQWSNLATFTTLKDPAYVCNDQTLPADPLQASPLPPDKAIVGLVIQSGQFEVTATEITSSGSAGWYKGKGHVEVFGGFPVAVKWKNIYIDDNNRHQQGVIEAVTQGINSWMQQWEVQQAEENAIYTNGVIDSVYVKGNQACYILQGNLTPQCEPFPSDANVLVIRDEDGNQYTITTNPPPAKIEGPTNYLVPSTDVLDANDSMIVTFSANATQNFGFDKKEYAAWGPDYELIKLKNGKNYFVPFKSVGETKSDEVMADLKIKNLNASLLSFKSKDNTAITSTSVDTNKYKITVPDNAETVYAWYGNKKIGKLNVVKLKPLAKKVVLVPVNNASIPTAVSGLNDIYKQANVSWTVSTAPSFTYDLGSNGLDAADATLMSKYSGEMRALRDAYRQQDTAYDKSAYYIFVVPAFSDPNLKGYMVRGRAVGFVTSNCNSKDLAHELAHGAFGMEHTFPKIKESSTNNLLDYGTGSNLTNLQWAAIHSNMIVLNWLDSEEDGAILDNWLYVLETINKIKTAHENDKNIAKSELPAAKNAVRINKANLGGITYDFIQLEISSSLQSIHPKGKVTEISATNMYGNTLYGLDIDGKIQIYVPQNRVANLKYYIISPADRNLLLFVSGFIPEQEFIKSPDVVYQSDVWNYWSGIDAHFVNAITTKNTLYASGCDHVWTSNHISQENMNAALASYLLYQKPPPQKPNYGGFLQRLDNGKKAGQDLIKKLHNGTITCRKQIINGNEIIIDTVDVVAHSMGFAYAQGMITELQKDHIHVGRYYIIAPENACFSQIPSGLEEAWQYGSNEKDHSPWELDGIAPQCEVPGINGLGDKGGRAFIPVEDKSIPTGFLDSHVIKNFGWIFKKKPLEIGYVKKRN